METKLRSSNRPWIKDKFDGVKIFSSGLDKGFLGVGVAIIMNTSLVHHVSKISEVPGWLLMVKLLFKNKLSVSILRLYARTSLAVMTSIKMAPEGTQDMAKTIDFLFIFSNLVNAVINRNMFDVAVSMSVSLGGFLNTWLNFLCKQANRDHWKFNFKGADEAKLKDFGNATLANALMFSDEFATAVRFSNLDTMWNVVHKIASVIQDVVNSGASSGQVCSALCGTRKAYHTSKFAEFLRAKEVSIRAAIDKRIKNFEVNKGHTIRSVLECLFHKVVLNYLVVDDELILEPNLVKSKMDVIMEGWTRKCHVVDDVSGNWCHQYQPLEYVFDEVFSDSSFEYAFGVSELLSEAWVSIIPKPYEWENLFMNTQPIALIKMAHKILSKILFDRISLAYSTFDVLHENNFLVLKSTTIQSPIFAIGLVIKDALEKNQELWMHLKKSLVKIKMCSKFIHFFSGIHKDCTNCIMTDFGLINDYWVHNSLDQCEVFFPLLWHIFYDSLLCEIKCQESVYRYRLNSYFVSKNGATQHIFDVASEFFRINNISINNNKTVVIPINSRFFTNLVLRKAISDKQLLYMVLAVFYLIISYRTQFSFVSVKVCNRWDALVCRCLKLKSGLPLDFPSDMIHHPFFYGLKSFFQVQSKSKIAFLISFVNSSSIVGCLFSHRSHDLQVLCWCPVHSLSSPVHIYVSAFNNFLADIVRVFLDCNLFLDESKFLRFLLSLKLDFRGPVPKWFKLFVAFLDGVGLSSIISSVLYGVGPLNILESSNFVFVCDHLSQAGAGSLSVYMDGSLNNLDTVNYRAGATTYFENIGLGLSVSVSGLMLSTLAELQTIVLALECVPLSSSVQLFSDSQFALDACKSELDLMSPDFYNQCWVKHYYIVNVVCSKNLKISWHKVKGHSGILGNKYTNKITSIASFSDWCLPPCLDEHFLTANSNIVSGNSRYFVRDVFHSVCHACWEVGSGSKFLADSLLSEVDWFHLSLVWHPDLNMATSFTSRPSTDACTYFMKALHYWLVLCLYCGKVEILDHVFSCKIDESAQHHLLKSHLLSSCVSDFFVFMTLYKGFVFDGWFHKAVFVFHNPKVASSKIVKFVHSLGLAFRTGIWLVHAKHHAYMEKNGLIPLDGSAVISVLGSALRLSASVVKLLGITDTIGVCFGSCSSYLFFSNIGNPVSVHITA
ncbi:hypothetical protein G9A89_013463 [Geosiphon pyriformis]|nr:hypothetical protein G9A89_013463 [Geosiphon pyriformis]